MDDTAPLLDSETRREELPVMNRPNWTLLLGALIVLMVMAVAVFGPSWAPNDPMEIKYIVRVGDTWVSPPFPPLAVPGRLLGSDEFGRDLLSRLLWAVRPTMITVLVVAGLRLLLGTLLGLSAGWFEGRAGRVLNGLIFGALAIPMLIVALAVIAALHIELGIWAFVIGLSITGWAESARMVAEQARGVKQQEYVEASRALGSGSVSVLARHVLRQVMPLLWMLFAFEISGTLLATAALGFLGYYIGGDAWISIEDSAAMRVSGMPDLGQLLSGTVQFYTNPWSVAFSGAVVFVTVLGFNLLGEGLRLQQSPERVRRRTRLSRATTAAREWTDRRVLSPVSQRLEPRGVRVALSVLVVAAIGGGLFWWRWQPPPPAPEVELLVPGGHQWATERHDAQGTLWTAAGGPTAGDVKEVLHDSAGFTGGPAIAADGTLYITSFSQELYALSPAGRVLWRVVLPVLPVRSPALGARGEIYIADERGGLTAYDPRGELAWHLDAEPAGQVESAPMVGPDGTIYYVLAAAVRAVAPDGHSLWTSAHVRLINTAWPMRLSPDGRTVFFQDLVLDAADGRSTSLPSPGAGAQQYGVGADGRLYYLLKNAVTWWRFGPGGAMETVRTSTWDYSRFSVGSVADWSVTRDQVAWLLYASRFNDARLVVLNMDRAVQSMAQYAQRETRAIGTDARNVLYVCGVNYRQGPQCLGFRPGSSEPAWGTALPANAITIMGGAVVEGRLYVATHEGSLYSIGR